MRDHKINNSFSCFHVFKSLQFVPERHVSITRARHTLSRLYYSGLNQEPRISVCLVIFSSYLSMLHLLYRRWELRHLAGEEEEMTGIDVIKRKIGVQSDLLLRS